MASSQVTFAAPGQAFKRSSASSQPPAYPVESKAKRITRIMLVVNKDFDQIQKKAPDVGFVFFWAWVFVICLGWCVHRREALNYHNKLFQKQKSH